MSTKINSNTKDKKGRNKEFLIKICCVIFAIALWFLVAGQNPDIQHEMTYYAVPVTIRNAEKLSDDHGLSIISGYDYSINITVRGNRAKLSNYSSEDIVASVDVAEIASSGDYNLGVMVEVPPSSGFTVVSKSLENISVSIDKLTSMVIDVDVNIINAQYDTESHGLGIPKVSPETIVVKGPQALLDRISRASVNLDLGNVTSTIGFNNRIILSDNDNNEIVSPYITLSDQFAEGTVPLISKEEAAKIITKNVKLTCSLNDNDDTRAYYSFDITPSEVTISGYESDLRKIEYINVFDIDETRITSNTVFSVPINAPDNTKLESQLKQAVVSINVSEKLKIESFSPEIVTYRNSNTEYSYELESIPQINLVGDVDVLSAFVEQLNLGNATIDVYIDVKLLSKPGIYKQPIKVEISNYNIWAEYAEAVITVNENA